MSRKTRSAFAAFVTMLVLLTSTSAIANHFAGSGGILGGFEIDGNLAFDAKPNATMDWENVPGRQVIFDPPEAAGADVIFTNGSKEQEPDGWSFTTGAPPSKADLTRAYVASEYNELPGHSLLWLGFER